jgi:hypothetical protein
VAKPKSAGLSFELLENRCLLNGAFWSGAPAGDWARDQEFLLSAPLDLVQHGGAIFRGADFAVDAGYAMIERFDGQVMRPIFVRTTGVPFLASLTETVVYSAPATSVMIIDISVTAAAGPAFVFQQADALEFLHQRFYLSNVSQPPAGSALPLSEKELDGAIGAGRELAAVPPPTVTPNQTAVPVSQPSVKDDHAAAPLAPAPKGQSLQIVAPLLVSPPAAIQPSVDFIDRQNPDRDWMTAAATPARPNTVEASPSLASSYLGRESYYLDSALPPPAPLLTNILPVDVASLESSIRDFFEQIDHAGVKLSQSQMSVLFSASSVAVAAMLALEIARRNVLQAAVPALTPRCEGSVPYSDYP